MKKIFLVVTLLLLASCSSGTSSGNNNQGVYKISGTVLGLKANDEITLINNDDTSEKISITKDGSFEFNKKIGSYKQYSVTILNQPKSKNICTVNNYNGYATDKDISDIKIICSDKSYTIGGSITGLSAGQQVRVVLNGTMYPDLDIHGGESSYVFSQNPIVAGGHYDVTISIQPQYQTCSITNPQGIVSNSNINNVNIVCSSNSYTIGGSVSGLIPGQQIILLNNGNMKDAITLTESNSYFTFAQSIPLNGSYVVTVGAQPTLEACSVTRNGSYYSVNANVTDVQIICSQDKSSIGGSVSGLLAGQSVTLVNNDNMKDAVTVTESNPNFTFTQPIPLNGSYVITVGAQPTLEVCSVTANGSGNSVTANVTNVQVTCNQIKVLIGGSVSGLMPGQSVTLLNNSNTKDAITLTESNPNFTFAQSIPLNGSYLVTVGAQPTLEACSVTANGSGNSITANVTNVQVTCKRTIGGNVVGLAPGQQVQLINNENVNNVMAISKNGPFNLPYAFLDSSQYSISVLEQPVNSDICFVESRQGTIAAPSNIVVQCTSYSVVDKNYTPGLLLNNPNGLFTSPDGKSLYAYINGNQSGFATFAIHPDGTLNQNESSLYVTVSGVAAMSNYDNSLYVAGSSQINSFLFNGGILSNYGSAYNPSSENVVSFLPGKKYAHLIHSYGYKGTIYTFSLNESGQIGNLVNNNPTNTYGDASGASAISPNGLLYLPSYQQNNSVAIYDVDESGMPKLVENKVDQNSLSSPIAITFSSDNKYAYVLNQNGVISSFNVDADGKLTLINSSIAVSGINQNYLTISPDNKYLVAFVESGNTTSGSAYIFPITDGFVDAPALLSTGNNPVSSVFSPSDNFLYIANNGSNSISIFKINSSSY